MVRSRMHELAAELSARQIKIVTASIQIAIKNMEALLKRQGASMRNTKNIEDHARAVKLLGFGDFDLGPVWETVSNHMQSAIFAQIEGGPKLAALRLKFAEQGVTDFNMDDARSISAIATQFLNHNTTATTP